MPRRVGLMAAALLAVAGCKKSKPAGTPQAAHGSGPALGGNVLANGDAEQVVQGQALPGWTTPADAVAWEAVNYGFESGEFGDQLPFPGAGKNYLRCSTTADKHCVAEQRYALDAHAADVDAGKLTAIVRGWFGSFGENDASGVLELHFLDASGKELGSIATPPSLHTERAKPSYGEAAMSQKEASAPVPPKTRAMRIVLHEGAAHEDHSDAYFADSLSVVLKKS